jgi:hypothetical protein
MGWLKQANKIGKYETTWNGFRIYLTKSETIKQYTEHREEGSFMVTDFGKREYVAVDKTGFKITDYSIEGIAYKIDFEILGRRL